MNVETAAIKSSAAEPSAAVRSAPHRYRPALDGVRAVAVFAVISYHLGYPWMRGGFLGVDIFFVLSGYLITSMLVSNLDRRGIQLGSFWARRARRLLPAVLVLCIAIAGAVHWMGPVPDWSQRQADLLWTIFYGMNWHLIASDQNYFAGYLGASPLRHAWSLSIEEQFYVAWPLALVLFTRWLRTPKMALAVLVVLGVIGSAVVMDVLFDPGAPSRAYYGTDSRAHQLLVGALLGLGMTWLPSLNQDRGKVVDLVAVVGTLTVATAFVAVPDSWPGYYRGGSLLLSVIVAVLLWTIESRPLGVVGRILSLAPLRWLGQISYGLYLWHWPVILFAGTALVALFGSRVSPLMKNSSWVNLMRILLTVGIASVSYYVLEQPIRRGKLLCLRLTNRWVLGLAPTAMLTTAVVSVLLTAVPPPTAKAIEPGEYTCPDLTVVCARYTGSSRSRPVLAVIGDSTARSLDSGITDLSQKYDWTYVAAAQDGCSIIDRVPVGTAEHRYNTLCPHLDAVVRQELLDVYRPNLIIAMERFLLSDFLGNSGQLLVAGSAAHIRETEQGLENVAAALTSRGAMLVFIDILPAELPLDCSNQSVGARPDCHVSGSSDQITAQYNSLIDRVAARHPDTMRVISLSSVVCPSDFCVPKIDGILLRYDRYHFTKAGAHWLAPYLYQELERVGAVPIALRPLAEVDTCLSREMMAAVFENKEASSMGRRSNYTSKQKAEIVLSVLTKQVTAAEACRRHGITETTLASWREQALEGIEKCRSPGRTREADLEREMAALV